MSDQNNQKSQEKKTNITATALKASKMYNSDQILRVKTYKAAAGFTSARPAKSFIKAKSLTKPLMAAPKSEESLVK